MKHRYCGFITTEHNIVDFKILETEIKKQSAQQ